MESNTILTILLFIPVLGAILLLFFNKKNENLIRYFGLTVSVIVFILSLILYFNFNVENGDFQFLYKFKWISNLNISFFVGLDGMSMLLLLLTTFITPLTLISSWSSIKKNVKEFTFFMLLLETGIIGVFISLDLFFFYFNNFFFILFHKYMYKQGYLCLLSISLIQHVAKHPDNVHF